MNRRLCTIVSAWPSARILPRLKSRVIETVCDVKLTWYIKTSKAAGHSWCAITNKMRRCTHQSTPRNPVRKNCAHDRPCRNCTERFESFSSPLHCSLFAWSSLQISRASEIQRQWYKSWPLSSASFLLSPSFRAWKDQRSRERTTQNINLWRRPVLADCTL